nr:hypothetical protein CFP56_22558 [Quercus suber]
MKQCIHKEGRDWIKACVFECLSAETQRNKIIKVSCFDHVHILLTNSKILNTPSRFGRSYHRWRSRILQRFRDLMHRYSSENKDNSVMISLSVSRRTRMYLAGSKWSDHTPQIHKALAPVVWTALLPALQSPPQPQLITLNTGGPSFYRNPSCVYEITTIQGGSELVQPAFLKHFDDLVQMTISGLSDEPAVDLVECARGFTDSDTTDGVRAIAAMWIWIDNEKRAVFMNPGQHSSGDGTQYEDLIKIPLHDLAKRGAIVESTLIQLQPRYTNSGLGKKSRCCTIL